MIRRFLPLMLLAVPAPVLAQAGHHSPKPVAKAQLMAHPQPE